MDNKTPNSTVLKLNVSGQIFTTYKSTVCKYKDSFLYAMFSGRHELVKDENGICFIDRPAKAFEIVLYWLQTGIVTEKEIKQVGKERFFNEMKYFGLWDFWENRHDFQPIEKVDRFSTRKSRSWTCNGERWDAISFYVNKNAILCGIGLFGGPSSTVKATEVYENEVLLYQHEEYIVDVGVDEIKEVLFNKKNLIRLLSGKMYTVMVLMHSKTNITYGKNGKPKIRVGGIDFEFNDTNFEVLHLQRNSNKSTARDGQIPFLLVKT